MSTAEDKVNFDHEYSLYHLQRTEDAINTIRAHAKWVLSILAAIVLGLASFVFVDFGELHIIYKELDKPDLLIKVFAGSLFVLYSGFILLFIPLLLWGGKFGDKNKSFVILSKVEETEMLKIRVNKSSKKLYTIDRDFKTLIALSIGSPFLSAIFSAYFTYLA